MSSDNPLLRNEIAEHIPWIAAVVKAPDEPIEDVNGAFLRKFGQSLIPADAMGLGPHVKGRSLRARIAEVMETGRPVRIHRCEVPRNHNGNGKRGARYVDLWLEPVKRDGVATGAVILYGVDVTHRVQAARALRRALQHEHKLLALLGTKVWGADPLGSEVWEIGSGPNVLMRPRNGSDGRSEPGGGASAPATDLDGSDWHEAVRARTPYSRVRQVKTDAGLRFLMTHAIPVLDEHEELVQWIGIDIDVSKHLQGFAGDGSGAAPAEVLENRIRNMRGFSHDVRNALHAADGYAQLLESRAHGPLNGEQYEYLMRMRTIFRGALGLLTDLLKAEGAITGELELEHKPTDVDSLITESAESHRAEAKLKQLIMQVEKSKTPLWTRTDPARVRQILDNLISNALKFTSHGSLTIRAQSDGARRAGDRRRWIRVSVTDTGPGIPKENEAAIFEEFVRLARADGNDGHGVGLAISRRLARLLGGEITVASREGLGSTFTLWLPLDWQEGAAAS